MDMSGESDKLPTNEPIRPRSVRGARWRAAIGLVAVVVSFAALVAVGLQVKRLFERDEASAVVEQGAAEPGSSPDQAATVELPPLPPLPNQNTAEQGAQPSAVSSGAARSLGAVPTKPPATDAAAAPRENVQGAGVSASPAAPSFSRPQTVEAAAEEMQQVVRRLLDDFPNLPEALDLMARVHLLFGRSSEAADCWKKAIETNPNDTRAYRGLASVAHMRNDPREQLNLLRKALAIDVRSFDVQFDLAKALVDQGQNREAIKLLEAHLVLYPNSPRSYSLLGAAYLQENAFKEAKQAYLAAVKLEPRDDFPYLGLAKACARLGEQEDAARYQKKFQELRNNTRQKIRSHRGRYEDLEAQCDTLSNICTNVGRIYHDQGRLEDAERAWRRAAAATPSHVDCRRALADLYARQRRTADLISILEELVRLVPDDAGHRLKLGRLYVETGQADKAEAVLAEASRRDPKNAESRAMLAELYLKADRKTAEAAALARQAAELSPKAEHYWLLSKACQRQGDLPAALAAIEKAVELDPGNFQYHEAHQALKEKK